MKICHISSFWPNRIAHTHYTDNLIGGIFANQPEQQLVLAERSAARAETERFSCVPCFDRDSDYVADIVAAARAAGRPDVAVIQYSNDLFGDDNRLPRLVAALAAEGIRPVVNCHSIYPDGWRTHFEPGRTAVEFDRALAEHAALLTVHTQRMKRDLLARGIDEARIAVIPHGSEAFPARDPGESRARLGIPPDAKVVLFFGFIWPGKGIDFLLSVFARVRRQVPDAYLFVGGHTRHPRWSIYVRYLRARARLLGFGDRSRFWGKYVPEEMIADMFSAASIVAMPYRQDYSSVSGVVHESAGSGKLMLCSRIAKFDEVTEIDPTLTVGPKDTGAWVDGMVRLLTDQPYAEAMRAKIVRFGQATSWPNVGKMHLETYARLVAGQHPQALASAVAGVGAALPTTEG